MKKLIYKSSTLSAAKNAPVSTKSKTSNQQKGPKKDSQANVAPFSSEAAESSAATDAASKASPRSSATVTLNNKQAVRQD